MSELEVIGYGSKLFRDDTAAQYCHDEKQLHPHELDPYCTIDRLVNLIWIIFQFFKNTIWLGSCPMLQYPCCNIVK